MSIIEQPLNTTTSPEYPRISPEDKVIVIKKLQALLGDKNVLHTPYDMALYEYDASIERSKPDIVVLPANNAEVAALVKIASLHHIPVIPRGAGTGLSGGAIPIYGGIIVTFTRMNRIIEIDYDNL